MSETFLLIIVLEQSLAPSACKGFLSLSYFFITHLGSFKNFPFSRARFFRFIQSAYFGFCYLPFSDIFQFLDLFVIFSEFCVSGQLTSEEKNFLQSLLSGNNRVSSIWKEKRVEDLATWNYAEGVSVRRRQLGNRLVIEMLLKNSLSFRFLL